MILTPVEKEVVLLIGRGKSNSEIARELRMSVGSVAYRLRRVFKTLNVTNRSNAYKTATRLGLIPFEPFFVEASK